MNTVKSDLHVLILACLAMLMGWFPGREVIAAGLEADMVIYNGKILTEDSPNPNNFSTAQAAAIYNGNFVAVGSNEQVMQYAGSKTQKIDLGGRTVVPGLVETHDHIYDYASHFFPPGAPQVGQTDPPILWTNKADFLAQLRTLALKKKPGEWIIMTPRGGENGIIAELQKGEVTRFDLDKVAPNNPVDLRWMIDEDGLVNTKALDMLLARYPKAQGLVRDAKGILTGHLHGIANTIYVYEFWPQIAPENLAPYYKMEMEELAAEGLTTVSSRLRPNYIAAYSWLHSRNDLPLRLAYSIDSVNQNPNLEATLSRMVGLQGGTGKNIWGAGDDMMWMIGMATPYNLDGLPNTGSSCVSKAYPREAPDFPMWRHQYYGPNGNCTLDSPDYNAADALRALAKYGFRNSGLHTGGDKGIDQYLDLLEQIAKQYPDIAERRWTIEHCPYLTDQETSRAKKLGIIFSCLPGYIYDGKKGPVGAFALLFGQQAAEDAAVPLRRMIDQGLRPTMELDRHAFHPFLALQVAVNRKDVTGRVWGPQQGISRQEALYAYTRWSSEFVLKENLLGSIEPGKHADFLVLNRDYLTVPEDEIGRIDPMLTVMGGKVTYSDPQFATSQGLPQAGYRGDRSRWMRGTPDDANKRAGGVGGS